MKRKPTPEEIAYQNALSRFENAVNLLNNNQLRKARAILERLVSSSALDLAERARVYVRVCDQRLSPAPIPSMKTADEFYNHGVRMANQGNLEDAEKSLSKALKLAPKADYIFYAMATTHALKENVEAAIENLQRAIDLNARNRYLARNDPDFSKLLEDPLFTELLYPEEPVS